MFSIILTVVAGIYIFFNGMTKGVMQVKIQILDNTGYSPGIELKTNRINFFFRWIVFTLVLFFIGWIEVIILIAINLVGFYISLKMTKDKYFDSDTGFLKQDVFMNEVGNNPLYRRL